MAPRASLEVGGIAKTGALATRLLDWPHPVGMALSLPSCFCSPPAAGGVLDHWGQWWDARCSRWEGLSS